MPDVPRRRVLLPVKTHSLGIGVYRKIFQIFNCLPIDRHKRFQFLTLHCFPQGSFHSSNDLHCRQTLTLFHVVDWQMICCFERRPDTKRGILQPTSHNKSGQKDIDETVKISKQAPLMIWWNFACTQLHLSFGRWRKFCSREFQVLYDWTNSYPAGFF